MRPLPPAAPPCPAALHAYRFRRGRRAFRAVALTVGLLLSVGPGLDAQARGRLQVAPNHRSLQYEDGRHFFYMADTAWMLLQRLNRDQASRYLEDRARKGFSVIQTVALRDPHDRQPGVPDLHPAVRGAGRTGCWCSKRAVEGRH